MEDLKRRRPKTFIHWSLEALRARQTYGSSSPLLGITDAPTAEVLCAGQNGAVQSVQDMQVEGSPISKAQFRGERDTTGFNCAHTV